jgi:hypothetical protein
MLKRTVNDNFFISFIKVIWKIFSGISGALGLASMVDGYIKWKSLVKKILNWYSENVYPFFDDLFSFLDISIPPIYYDYLVVGLVISSAIIKYYFLAWFRGFVTHRGMTKLIDKYYEKIKRYELRGQYGKYPTDYQLKQLSKDELTNGHIYFGSFWTRFLIGLRAFFTLGYMHENRNWPYYKFIWLSFLFSYFSMLTLWPLMLPLWIRKALNDNNLDRFKTLYIYDGEIQNYRPVPKGQVLNRRKAHYYYDSEILSYRRAYIKKNAYLFLEILGFVLIGFLILIVVSEFF